MKSVRFCFILLIISIVTGCTTIIDKRGAPPENLIHRDTMVNIFIDLVLMDAIVFYEQRQGRPQAKDIAYFLHNSITEKYNISREQFEESFDYYQRDLAAFDKMMGDAITKLSIMQAELEKK